MLTNLYEAEHSMIDPYTEAVQICGRFRKEINGSTFNSITHLTNVRATLKVKTDEEIDIELEEKLKTYESLQARYNETTDATRKKALIDDINRLGLAEFATVLFIWQCFKGSVRRNEPFYSELQERVSCGWR